MLFSTCYAEGRTTTDNVHPQRMNNTGFALRAYVMGDDGSEYTAHQIALSSAVRRGDGDHGRDDGLTTKNDDDIFPELEPFTDDNENGRSSCVLFASPPWGSICTHRNTSSTGANSSTPVANTNDDKDDLPELVSELKR